MVRGLGVNPLLVAVDAGSLLGLGRCLDRSWQQKKLMAPGCEPTSVRAMMDALRPLVLGQSLAGAGGGGFLYVLTREPHHQEAVLRILNDTPVRTRTCRVSDVRETDTETHRRMPSERL